MPAARERERKREREREKREREEREREKEREGGSSASVRDARKWMPACSPIAYMLYITYVRWKEARLFAYRGCPLVRPAEIIAELL